MNYKELLNIAVKATILAGEEVLNQYKNGFEVNLKKDNSPVTSADLAAHDILTKHLSKSKLPIISEEGDWFTHEERQIFPAYWILDPIDGTRDFVNKTDEFCICTGLISENSVKLGVLYAPALNLLYFGGENYPSRKFDGDLKTLLSFSQKNDALALLEKESKFLPSLPSKDKFTFLTSRFHKDNLTNDYIKKLKEVHPDIEVLNMGCAIKLGLIADRFASEYTRFLSVNFWDIAAGHAIAKYAGLKVNSPNTNEEIKYTDKNMKVHGYSIKWD